MPVALHYLGRAWSRPQARFLAHVLLDEGIYIGDGTDSPGNLAVGDRFAGSLHAAAVPLHFVMPQSHFDAEGNGFRMNPVRAADHRRHPVLIRPLLDYRHEPVDIVDNHIGSFSQQHGERRVQNIR